MEMQRYTGEAWYLDHIAEMFEQYGDFPPPWVYVENSHPYSIGWRMGDGESHLMAFGEWWAQENKTLDQRIQYFRKWPPPPRWCAWMAEVIWDLHPWEGTEEFDYSPYFGQLKAMGFDGTDEYLADLDNDTYE